MNKTNNLGLNKQQEQAINCTEGPVLIVAGAGSGKTHVVINRIVHLLNTKNIYPHNILALTFTNKAAREMKERLESLVNVNIQTMWISTFHSMCVRILRNHIDKLGYRRDFTIFDQIDVHNTLKRIIKDMNIDEDKYAYKNIAAVISNAKNNNIAADKFSETASSEFDKMIAKIYQAYQGLLMRNSSVDFDDLIMKTLELFSKHTDVLEKYQNQFAYIHVDEYQDTNQIQYKLIYLLAGDRQNVCVVGDADQSIYGWRGADMNIILNFERHYKGAKVILLEQNYRSTQTILEAANAVIENNKVRRPKKLWTSNEKGEKIQHIVAYNERKEVEFVVEKIRELAKLGESLANFAVFYRTNSLSRRMEEQLIKEALPYHVYGGFKFYERKEIKDLLAYLRLINNNDDDNSFLRVINVPRRGIGAQSIEKIRSFAIEKNISLLQALEALEELCLTASVAKGCRAFGNVIKELTALVTVPDVKLTDLVENILKQTGYRENLGKRDEMEKNSILENIDEFLSVTSSYDSKAEENFDLTDFLTDVSLLTDQSESSDAEDKVQLMTLHAAKGLEFPYVFIIGMEEKIFPSERSIFEDNLEEERRIAYVGITRAKKQLFLLRAKERYMYRGSITNLPSRFIDEIPDEFINTEENQVPWQSSSALSHEYTPKTKPAAKTKVFIANSGGAELLQWSIGDKVDHPKWGIGTVHGIEGSGAGLELTITFPNEGKKRLRAKFAPIKKWIQ